MNNAPEGIRQRNKDAHQNAALHWNRFANEQELELTRQLLYFAAIIFPITASIAVLNREQISGEIKVVLIITWIFLILSICCGVIQIILNIRYFVYLLCDESKRSEIWSQSGKDNSELQKEEKMLGRTRPNSGHLYLVLQGVFLFLAFASLMAISIISLYQ